MPDLAAAHVHIVEVEERKDRRKGMLADQEENFCAPWISFRDGGQDVVHCGCCGQPCSFRFHTRPNSRALRGNIRDSEHSVDPSKGIFILAALLEATLSKEACVVAFGTTLSARLQDQTLQILLGTEEAKGFPYQLFIKLLVVFATERWSNWAPG
ncbi:hypothetical protein [Microvirga sp. TS319]|uniref:hypothetical protein n=1 Tax=Microvirga sp. TS319 TaxID=3241165 RepID=UPI00351A4559